MIKERLCDTLGNISRSMPNFRGKNRLMMLLLPLLVDNDIEQECLKTIKMRDGSIMQIDLRNFENKVFFTGLYEPGVMDVLFSIIKPNSTVFDVGANIGFYSINLGRKLKEMSEGSKLYAFEPVKNNFQRLEYLIELNKLTDVIIPFNIALGNTQGEISLHLQGKGSTGNAFWIKEDHERSDLPNCSSNITKLDTFVEENNIEECDLIKVDIEGAELDFLKGGANFINKYRPIILSEFNPYHVQVFGYTFKEISDITSSWGYKLYEKKRLKKYLIPIEKETLYTSPEILNIFMIPHEKADSISKLLQVKK